MKTPSLISRKTFSNPEAFFDPPNLITLVDRMNYAIERPKSINKTYLKHLRADLKEAHVVMKALEQNLAALEDMQKSGLLG